MFYALHQNEHAQVCYNQTGWDVSMFCFQMIEFLFAFVCICIWQVT